MKKYEVAASFTAAAEPATAYMPIFFDPLGELTKHRPSRSPQSELADPKKSASRRGRPRNRSRDRSTERSAMIGLVVHDLHALGARLSSTTHSSGRPYYLQIGPTELPPLSCRGEASGAI
jgi:hypothetical protein